MPAGKLLKYGVWENDKFIGAILFGRGANNNAHKSLGVKVTECCELVRVALKNGHKNPTTKIIAIALRLLKKDNKGIRVIFSYADETNQGHKGVIYKAGNWEYLGTRTTNKGAYYYVNGKKMHGRSVRAKWGSHKNVPHSCVEAPPETKHLFIYKMRQ
jgi:hypothetical protein